MCGRGCPSLALPLLPSQVLPRSPLRRWQPVPGVLSPSPRRRYPGQPLAGVPGQEQTSAACAWGAVRRPRGRVRSAGDAVRGPSPPGPCLPEISRGCPAGELGPPSLPRRQRAGPSPCPPLPPARPLSWQPGRGPAGWGRCKHRPLGGAGSAGRIAELSSQGYRTTSPARTRKTGAPEWLQL